MGLRPKMPCKMCSHTGTCASMKTEIFRCNLVKNPDDCDCGLCCVVCALEVPCDLVLDAIELKNYKKIKHMYSKVSTQTRI